MSISKLGIVGAGDRGIRLSEAAARAGLSVLLVEKSKEDLENAAASIKKLLSQSYEKDEAKQQQIIARIQLGLDVEALKDVDFIIETLPDDEEKKMKTFQQIDALVATGSVLATTTNVISVTKLASLTQRPGLVVGMNFSGLRMVEVVRGVKTSETTIRETHALVAQLGYEAINVHDFPGHVVGRVMSAMINEAVWSLYEGIASAPDIDKAMKGSLGYPIGPLAMADMMGLDRVLSILKALHQQTLNQKYVPCPLLIKYIEAGYLGRKSGKGFYEY